MKLYFHFLGFGEDAIKWSVIMPSAVTVVYQVGAISSVAYLLAVNYQ